MKEVFMARNHTKLDFELFHVMLEMHSIQISSTHLRLVLEEGSQKAGKETGGIIEFI